MAPQGRKIAIIGASGQLGKPTVDALLAQGVHTVTAIQRSGATSTFPSAVIVKTGDLASETFLDSALRGQDALVLMPPLSHLHLQEPAIRAAAKVGVPYVVPSEFGPDPFAKQLTEKNILLITKKRFRDLIEELGVSSWVSPTVGPWLDAAIDNGMWGVDVKGRKATIWKGAEAKVNTATILHAAELTSAVLSLPEAELARYKNKAVYGPSFLLTQREIFQAIQRATGTTDADWDIEVRDVNDMAKEYEEAIKNGDGMAPYVKFYVTHFLEGHGGNFEHKVDAADLAKLEQYGLHKENLDEAVKAALQ